MILIVDDDYDIASLVRISLEKAGLSASAFANPLIALEEFRSHSTDYDLLISDIRMPAMNGYELVQHVKEIKPDVRILLTSACEYDSKYLANGLSHLDIAGFIEKPISMSELRKVIFTALDHNTAAAAQQHSHNDHLL